MRGSRLLAASPRFHKAPGPRALRLHEAPCASAGRAPQNARGPTAARHCTLRLGSKRARSALGGPTAARPCTLRLGYRGFGSAISRARCDPSLPRAPCGLTVISIAQNRAPCASAARGRPRSDAKPCVLKHSGGLVSWRFLGCSRRDARLLKNSGRVEQSPPTRAAARATAGLTREGPQLAPTCGKLKANLA